MGYKIIKSFDKNISIFKIETGTHTINYCSWERLKPYLEQANGGSPIKGIRADENGIEIILKD